MQFALSIFVKLPKISRKYNDGSDRLLFDITLIFLAYLAFVKDEEVYHKMSSELQRFIKKRDISFKEKISYKRFGENYLLSLPVKKQIYYLLCFLRLGSLVRKIL